MKDTIAAIATPPGKGGVAIVRVSGQESAAIAKALLNKSLRPRMATLTPFNDESGNLIDQGLALFFNSPQSLTGEDVLELQCHGGVLVTDQLLKQVLHLGARLAKPGEFSERAFLNGKLDLLQAEAIADLINASSQQAARLAARSLQGSFSKEIERLLAKLIALRTQTEATIDFAEEAIDFIDNTAIVHDIQQLLYQLDVIEKSAQQGVLLQEGLTVAIVGKPNVGKSSLLNALSGYDRAIVTSIAGTTRDLLSEFIQIDGMPLKIIDTAGIHPTENEVEQEGIRRAKQAMTEADLVLLMQDAMVKDDNSIALPSAKSVVIIRNKIDLLSPPVEPSISEIQQRATISLSVKTGQGLDLLRHYLKKVAGFESGEGSFIARRRHLEALHRCRQSIQNGLIEIEKNGALELLGEELRYAQQALSEITGQFTTDDLLGRIFSTFCIGK